MLDMLDSVFVEIGWIEVCRFKAGYKKEVAYDGKKSRMELRCGCEA